MECKLIDNESLASISFQNAEQKPLENLTLTVSGNGISRTVPALNEYWIENRYFLHYEIPVFHMDDRTEIVGAKEHWIELVSCMIDDFTWLLTLPHHKFWSNVVYNSQIMVSLVSVLQKAPPYYALESFPHDKEITELLNKLLRNIIVIFARLVTNKEKPTEYMKHEFQGNLLYNNYIFTIPVVFDLCQQFGRENKKTVGKILSCLFTLQPLYLQKDLKESITFLIQVFRNIQQRFEDCPVPLAGEVVLLTEKGGASLEISLPALEDIILYLLDTVSTIGIFLENYSPAVSLFHTEQFLNKIVSVYENTIPEMYKKLQILACKDETMLKFNELKHFLDVTRIEFLKLYRTIIYKDIGDVLEAAHPLPDAEVKERVDTFIELLSNALAEKEFMTDYYRLYPIDIDIDILSHICPEVDSMKCEYILNSAYAAIESSDEKIVPSTNDNAVAGPSNVQNNQYLSEKSTESGISESMLVALMADVKDILCDLGEGFIEKCLKYYNYNSESVINAVLEDSLPPDLRNLDTSMPYIPEEKIDSTISKTIADVDKLSLSENDIDEICRTVAEDVIDSTKVNHSKRQDQYSNLNEMLNDKSHLKQTSDIYNKYSLVADEYDDEYDDTYDSHDIGAGIQDDAMEFDRPFTTPRVLLRNDVDRNEDLTNYEELEQDTEERKSNRDNFCQDPAELRAKAEQRRLSKRGEKSGLPSREKDVRGKPKGQGQDKNITNNRDYKNTHKSSQGNHNRRAGSSWKKRQGMVPS